MNYISLVTYANLTILLADVHIDSGYLVVVTKEGVLVENESENGIFQMYGINGAGHAPSLYTKYYSAW